MRAPLGGHRACTRNALLTACGPVAEGSPATPQHTHARARAKQNKTTCSRPPVGDRARLRCVALHRQRSQRGRPGGQASGQEEAATIEGLVLWEGGVRQAKGKQGEGGTGSGRQGEVRAREGGS